LEQLTEGLPDPFGWSGVPKSHSGLRVQWAVRRGPLGRLIADLLFNAHELRKKADYDLDLVFTPQDKDQAFRFVARALLAVRSVR
jgi:hypothetical protein